MAFLQPQTVRDAEIQTLPGFVAELVYEVPRDSQGSWVSLGGFCRSADRVHDDPSDRNNSTGFRLARGH